MSTEATPAPDAAQPQEGAQAIKTESDSKTFDAEYVEKLRKEAAKYRTEAKANAEAAKKLADLEESQKSEVQKAADAKAQAEKDRDDARAEALRLRIATKHGISDEDADLFLTGTDEDTLTRQAERLAGRESERKKQGNVAPKEGANNSPSTGGDNMREFTRNLFASAD